MRAEISFVLSAPSDQNPGTLSSQLPSISTTKFGRLATTSLAYLIEWKLIFSVSKTGSRSAARTIFFFPSLVSSKEDLPPKIDCLMVPDALPCPEDGSPDESSGR